MPEINVPEQGSLLPEQPFQGELRRIPISQIVMDHATQMMIDNDFYESIRTLGVLQPIVVTESQGVYHVRAGRRRLRAAHLVGFTDIPAVVLPLTYEQQQAVSLVENDQRSPNPLSDLQAINNLIASGHTAQSIARELGMTRGQVLRRLVLNNLNTDLLGRIGRSLSASLAEQIARLHPSQQEAIHQNTLYRRITIQDIRDVTSDGRSEPGPVESREMFTGAEMGGMVRVGEGMLDDGRAYEIMLWRNEQWVPRWVSTVEGGIETQADYSGWGGVFHLLTEIDRIMPVEPNDDTDAFYAAMSEMRERVGRRISS